jgi:CRP-like cAMP-binding protein
MAAMARIEMVVFLQRVDLFTFCTAEQVVQLAAIASERRCTVDEVIYRRNDQPDALYCVVEGAVRLKQPGREDTEVRSNGRFGVVDILSGRRRTDDAFAVEEGTRLLTIEAEDFFDLLSHNIEIVKALFRQVL